MSFQACFSLDPEDKSDTALHAAGDAISLFKRCFQGLKEDGIIIVKENVCSNESSFVVDKVNLFWSCHLMHLGI